MITWRSQHFVIARKSMNSSWRKASYLKKQARRLVLGSFYLEELVGCRVVEQASGAELGRVREVLPTGGTDLLAVDTPEGKELLIPLAEEFCLRVAPEEKLIQVILPEGLRDLNR